MEAEAQARTVPLAGVIREAADGSFYLEGSRCGACGEVLVADHRACPNCAAADSLAPMRLADRGKLYTYTIVHRSFPGVVTPLISAVIRLDSGGFIKGNLIGIPPDPAAIAFDMPVRVEFERIGRADDGGDMIRYVFVADDASSGAEQ
jgi:uncharacterized OB-fold protein